MPKKLSRGAHQLTDAINAARQETYLMARWYQLMFKPDEPEPQVLQLLHRRSRMLHVLWDKLDVHFRNVQFNGEHPEHDRPLKPWDDLSGHLVSVGTPDMLFHSPPKIMSSLIAECNARYLWSRRTQWWGMNTVRYDILFTLHLFSMGRHLNRLYPEHPGHFTEYGSVPMRELDHEVEHRKVRTPKPAWLSSKVRDQALRYPRFPVPVQSSGKCYMVHPTPEYQALDPGRIYRVELRPIPPR